MLQRIASNAYSWWWASHIRTKQSKWMEQNLQGQLFPILLAFKQGVDIVLIQLSKIHDLT